MINRILDQLQKRDPELAKQVHIFNSFFYKRLTQRNRNSRYILTVELLVAYGMLKQKFYRKEETVYDRVKKWTAKMNLFEKSYVLIPINEKYVPRSSIDLSETCTNEDC
jgi:Ulp1 family protease